MKTDLFLGRCNTSTYIRRRWCYALRIINQTPYNNHPDPSQLNAIQQQRRYQSSSSSSAFESQLEESGFGIFQKTADYGYYAWRPRGLPKSVDRIVSSYEITDCLDWGQQQKTAISSSADHHQTDDIRTILPKLFVGLENISLPFQFQKLPFHRIDNRFPYGHFEIASLVVAAKRNVFRHHTVDFVFSSRALEWLARKRMTQGKMIVVKIPMYGNNNGTPTPPTITETKHNDDCCILITRYEDYATDYASIGHQFKRIMACQSEQFEEGGNMALEFIEHLQVLKVGDFQVLCVSEPDAVEKTGDDDHHHPFDPIKVKVSKIGRYHPDIFDTNILFNLITGGFPRLYHGARRDYTTLFRIDKISLAQFATSAFTNVMSRISLEDNILSGLECLSKQMKHSSAFEVFEASFDKGPLTLTPCQIPVLPPASIFKEVMTTDDDTKSSKHTSPLLL
jgi:hypothetical protein